MERQKGYQEGYAQPREDFFETAHSNSPRKPQCDHPSIAGRPREKTAKLRSLAFGCVCLGASESCRAPDITLSDEGSGAPPKAAEHRLSALLATKMWDDQPATVQKVPCALSRAGGSTGNHSPSLGSSPLVLISPSSLPPSSPTRRGTSEGLSGSGERPYSGRCSPMSSSDAFSESPLAVDVALNDVIQQTSVVAT